MSQRDDFTLGAIAGGIIWMLFIANGGTFPQGTSAPIDAFLLQFTKDAVVVKSFIFYVLIGGVLGTIISPLIERAKGRL